MYESETSVQNALAKVRNQLKKLAEIDRRFSDAVNESESALAQIEDISRFVRTYNSALSLNREDVEAKRERLGALNMLKKKYGGSVKSVLEYRKKIGEEYELADNFADKIKEMVNAITELGKNAGSIAKKLSEQRSQAAKHVKKGIEETLKELGIPHPEFKTDIKNNQAEVGEGVRADGKYYKANNKGIDEVEFFISTNPGEDMKPLPKVASGGEVSRIMLALKSTLAKNDKLPLLIFDEIDVGVSGRIALKVGNALKELSKYHQIISITHLPQIAGVADHHYSIEKVKKDDRVVSSIRKLKDSERIVEVAKLLSGEKVTEASLKTARELISSKE
jgi:DNA repair protein RecN (Recombination protein N)